ncbi:MAG: DedA family protein [Gemmatimonadota bacterium]|nr:DedA family protein [Gemmatimonadota bacterium]
MLEQLEALLGLIASIPVEVAYIIVGVGAAVENVFPPVPSDLAVLAGGILAERGILNAKAVFLVAWLSNLALALAVYLAAYRFGAGVFSTRWGHWLLRPAQLRRMAAFYEEYGTITVLVSRFFPVFRVLVPAFAGISRLGFWRTALPLMVASAAWYGVLIWAGAFFSRNLPRLLTPLGRVNSTAAIIAACVALVLGVLWWRTRADEPDDGRP